MKTRIRIFTLLSIVFLLTNASAFATTWTVGSIGADFTSVQLAINASAASGTVTLLAGNTFTENVNIDRILTITGEDTTAKIHGSITINANSVTLGTFVVYGSSGTGISATGRGSLTFNSIVSRNNTGSGIQLTNCTTVTLTDCIFSNNLDEGFNAIGGGSTYTMTRVHADSNGSGANGSGINLKGMSTITLTDLSANKNHHHGLSVGDGASGVSISGGNFTGNGTGGNATTGGGINFIASGTTTTSSITVVGIVNSSNNTTAGIYIFADNATVNAINGVTIGATGSITLSNNGSFNGTYGGGAGVLIFGKVASAHVTAAFTKGAAPGAGLMNLGDSTSEGSPTGTTLSNSTLSGYTSAFPAVTLTDGQGHRSLNDLASATNNTFTFPVAAKVFLQGPFSGPTMGTALATSHYLPKNHPYSAAPFNYGASDNVSDTTIFINDNVTDWVLLELRSTYNNATPVSRRAALLKNDGTVLDTNGLAGVLFTQTLAGGYKIMDYVVVKHRNHLAIMSKDSLALPNEANAYDFTTLQTKAYGVSPMRSLTGGVFGLQGGDANQDGGIDGLDRNAALNGRNLNGYRLSDLNLDGTTDGLDRNLALNNRNILTQLP